MTAIQVGKHYKNAILGSARKAPGGIYPHQHRPKPTNHPAYFR